MQQPTRIYLDNAATTPLGAVARAAMEPYLGEVYGNASSPYAVSRMARMAIDRARAEVAQLVGATPDEIVFTSGGTESDNWALLGVGLRELSLARNSGGNPNRGRHIVISAVEHHAVLEAAVTLAEIGFEVEIAAADCEGVVSARSIEALLRPETVLVSIMAVNNEVGTVQPLAEISALVRSAGNALLHTDAVQAAGKIDIAGFSALVDLISLSAHKFEGPKGAGALFVRRGVRLHSLLRGGGQERGRRAGTENVAAIAGMGAAAAQACKQLHERAAALQRLRMRFECGLEPMAGAFVNGAGALRAPHITNVSLPGRRDESLALALDLQGFAVGTGSACASGAIEASHVLAAMGQNKETARAALRVSVGVQNTLADIDSLLAALGELTKRKLES